MTIKLSQGLRASQHLTLTPTLQKAIELLQLSNMELHTQLQTLVQGNPFLELEESRYASPSRQICQTSSGSSNDFDPFYNVSSTQDFETLMHSQICQLDLSLTEFKIALSLLECLDQDGRCIVDLLGCSNRLKVTQQAILDVLSKLQTLEPTGVFARTLQECFKIQLVEKNKWNDDFEVFLSFFSSGITVKEVTSSTLSPKKTKSCIDELKKLDPFPLRGYVPTPVSVKAIDGIIYLDDTQTLQASLNEETLPKVYLNSSYYYSLNSKNISQEEKTFIKKNYQEGLWLLKALDQRYQNLLKILNGLITLQPDFFTKGVEYLNPMTLKDLANCCDLHESTISRCFQDKYIQTPQGTFEMKYFLSRRVQTPLEGLSISSTCIQERLRKLIETEDHNSPYSDQDMVDIFKKEGVLLARRTVTKYREKLAYAPSSVRKKIYTVKGKAKAI